MSDDVSFRSKVDAWLIAVIATAVVFVAQGFQLRETSPEGSVISWSVAALVGAIFIAVAVPCRYTLERDHLHIRSGFIQQRIAPIRTSRPWSRAGIPWPRRLCRCGG